MAKQLYFTSLDTENHVAITDEGHILGIEDYWDENEDPCYPDDAKFVFVRTGTYSYQRLELVPDDF